MTRPLLGLLAALTLSLPAQAQADPVAELRAALARWPAKTAFSGRAQVQGEMRLGGDATPLAASVQVDDAPSGLRLSYTPELLSRLEAEVRAVAATPTDQNPPRRSVKSALAELSVDTLRPLLDAGDALASVLALASCSAAQDSTWAGKPAQLVACTLRRPALSERERGYVKQYDGKLSLWLAPDGTPLASKRSESFSGRAMVVITFDSQVTHEASYAVVGDRLITTRLESTQSGSGGGERSEGKRVWTLTPR